MLGGQHGRRPDLRLRHALPLPGARDRRARRTSRASTSTPTRAHRVTLLATTDNDGAPLPDIDGSTWDPFAKRLLFTAESNAHGGGVWQATLDYPHAGRSTSARHHSAAAATRASRPTRTATSGSSRTSAAAAPPARTRKQPNSFVYRFVPKDPTDLTRRQAAGAAGESLASTGDPIVVPRRPGGRRHRVAGHEGPAHVRAAVRHHVDHAPRHGHRRHRRRSTPTRWPRPRRRTPFKRPENGVFQPGTRFRAFASPRPVTRTRRPRPAPPAAASARCPDARPAAARRRRPASCTLLFAGRPGARRRSTTSAVLTDRTVLVVEDRGDGLTRPAQRLLPTRRWTPAGRSTRRSTTRSRRRRGALPRRGPRRLGDDRLGAPRHRRVHERRRQRDHRHPRRPTATRRWPACSARAIPSHSACGVTTTGWSRRRARRRWRRVAGLLDPAARRRPPLGADPEAVDAARRCGGGITVHRTAAARSYAPRHGNHLRRDRPCARLRELIERERAALLERTPGSQAAYERAVTVMPRGVPSSFQAADPRPTYLSHGEGARSGTSTATSTSTSTTASA